MHEVAYSGGLARPLVAPESALKSLTADRLAEFVARNYTAPRVCLAGAGVSQVQAACQEHKMPQWLVKAPHISHCRTLTAIRLLLPCACFGSFLSGIRQRTRCVRTSRR